MKFSVFCEQTRKLFDTILHSDDPETRSSSKAAKEELPPRSRRRPPSPVRLSKRTGRDARLFSTDSKRRRRAADLLHKSSVMRRSWLELNQPSLYGRTSSLCGSAIHVPVTTKAVVSQVAHPVKPAPSVCPRLRFNDQQEPDVVDQLSVLTVECEPSVLSADGKQESVGQQQQQQQHPGKEVDAERVSPGSYTSSCSTSSPASSSTSAYFSSTSSPPSSITTPASTAAQLRSGILKDSSSSSGGGGRGGSGIPLPLDPGILSAFPKKVHFAESRISIYISSCDHSDSSSQLEGSSEFSGSSSKSSNNNNEEEVSSSSSVVLTVAGREGQQRSRAKETEV